MKKKKECLPFEMTYVFERVLRIKIVKYGTFLLAYQNVIPCDVFIPLNLDHQYFLVNQIIELLKTNTFKY